MGTCFSTISLWDWICAFLGFIVYVLNRYQYSWAKFKKGRKTGKYPKDIKFSHKVWFHDELAMMITNLILCPITLTGVYCYAISVDYIVIINPITSALIGLSASSIFGTITRAAVAKIETFKLP